MYSFVSFSMPHWAGLLIPIFWGVLLIITARRNSGAARRRLDFLLAGLLIAVRGARYCMDMAVGTFQIYDLLSFHVCHIDLILLLVCLFSKKQNKALYYFVFLLGIPTALSVAIFPGRLHPPPGLSRAVLFIMSHMLLVMSAFYLAFTRNVRLTGKGTALLLAVANLLLPVIYAVNWLLGTNFLYVQAAPPGTIIEKLYLLAGWPGYVLLMDGIAVILVTGLFFLHKALAVLQAGAFGLKKYKT